MKTKFLLVLIFCSLFSQVKSQQNSKFEFWISSLDKAAFSRITYHITENEITIKSGPYDFIYFAKNYKKDKIVFKLKLDSLQKIKFKELGAIIKNDSLKSQYNNLCIIDGTIIHFLFEWNKLKKSTTISNYYLPILKPFVDFVNEKLPEKNKIYYDKADLEKLMKDCPADRILN